jgi:hypothetical protein
MNEATNDNVAWSDVEKKLTGAFIKLVRIFLLLWSYHKRHDRGELVCVRDVDGNVASYQLMLHSQTFGCDSRMRVAESADTLDSLMSKFCGRYLYHFDASMFLDFCEAVTEACPILEDGSPDFTYFTSMKFFEESDRVFGFTEKLASKWHEANKQYVCSSGIHEGPTWGYGDIDNNGFWMFALYLEIKDEDRNS